VTMLPSAMEAAGAIPVERWLHSGQILRVSGLDFVPVPHPLMADTPRCVVKGQASVFFLRQIPHDHMWLLKKFAPSKRPSDAYLEAVTRCLPGGMEFFTCVQRRLLTARHMDWQHSGFRDRQMGAWLEGTVLMPKVPGQSWASVADDLREGQLGLCLEQRLRAALNLTECVGRLEAGGCAHRDLSATNVFLSETYRTYLIDWDCLYHNSLDFQPNTTIGTLGYIAPFTRGVHGNWEAGRSWCQGADRFALATLVAEFLLVGPETEAQEDGTLFSQAQLEEAGDPFAQKQLERLSNISWRCKTLVAQALRATSFETCPGPAEWRGALRQALRLVGRNTRAGPGRTADILRVKTCCARCGQRVCIDGGKLAELRGRGNQVLCRACLRTRLEEQSLSRRQRNARRPPVSCEHCGKCFRLPRRRLDLLRSQGRPLLCSACLLSQLRCWEMEQTQLDQTHPLNICARCSRTFRMKREKVEALAARGTPLLCAVCLKTRPDSRSPPARLRS